MRWIKLCEDMNVDPKDVPVYFLEGTAKLSNDGIRKMIDEEAKKHGGFKLIIVDTFAAYFEGDDENANVKVGEFTRVLRKYTTVPGKATVIVTAHPTKNYNAENLLPRGGGATLAEVDGNLVTILQRDTMTVTLYWHGKIRGPDFKPPEFKLVSATSDRLKTAKGRQLWTVTAHPISTEEKEQMDASSTERQIQILEALIKAPDASLSRIAEEINAYDSKGEPYKTLVRRALLAMRDEGLVKEEAGQWVPTKIGRRRVQERPATAYQPQSDARRAKPGDWD
jgi:AAA domain